MGEVVMSTRGLTRHFGGLAAVNGVSLDAKMGELHAVIGPNGAGKSTLINILSGEIPPSSGSVELLGQDVTAWTQPKRARAGLGRSYQRNTIYPTFSVFENCRLAAQARTQKPGAWWQSAQRCEASTAAARAATSRAMPVLAWQVCASCHQRQGFCVCACAARRQFSKTVKLG